MNMDLVIQWIPGVTVVFFLVGLYKTLLEKQVQAQERIQGLLGDEKKSPIGGVGARDQESVLKKRKKKKEGEQQTAMDRIELKLERANIAITPNEFLMISAGAGVVGVLLFKVVFAMHIVLAVLIGFGCCFLPYGFILLKGMLRMKKAAAQFADVLDTMVNGFKTGFGFSRAVQMIADNYDDPWGTEFGKMAAEMNLGSTQEDALYGLAKRVPMTDVDLFVTALLIQKETGGSLAELLGNLSKTCRDRYKLYQKVGAISAQGKLSASIVCCIPFVLCGLMFLFLPEAMMKFVTNPIGIILLVLAGFWMVCGIGVLFKIVNIEV